MQNEIMTNASGQRESGHLSSEQEFDDDFENTHDRLNNVCFAVITLCSLSPYGCTNTTNLFPITF